jgi:hypothetical protein
MDGVAPAGVKKKKKKKKKTIIKEAIPFKN